MRLVIHTFYCYSITPTETICTQSVPVTSPLTYTLDHVVKAIVCEDIVLGDDAAVADTSEDRSIFHLRLVAICVHLTACW